MGLFAAVRRVAGGGFLCRDETERRRIVDLSTRMRKASPFAIGAYALAGVSGIAKYGVIPLIPAFVAILAYVAAWKADVPWRRRPELIYIGLYIFTELMMGISIWLAPGPRSFALPIMLMPPLMAAVVFPRRVVYAMAAYANLLMLAIFVGADMPEVRSAPPLVFGSVVISLAFLATALAMRDLDEANRRSAAVDDLTGMLNRSSLESRLAEIGHQTAASGAPVAVIIGDIDHFKAVNDTYGHQRGDEVLRSLARRLADCVGAFEPVYRLGGEEFLIILPGKEPAEALAIAEHMRDRVRRESIADVAVTMSFGVAASPRGETFDFEALFLQADSALLAAKRRGRDRVEDAPAGARLLVVAPQDASAPSAPQPVATVETPRNLSDTDDLRREYMLKLNRQFARLFLVFGTASLGVVAGAIPWQGWHTLIPPIIGAVPYLLCSLTAGRFRKPERPLLAGWMLFQTSIAIGFLQATAKPVYGLSLLALMIPGRTAVLPRREAVIGTLYTACLVVATAFALAPQDVLGNPAEALFPAALVLQAAFVGMTVGSSSVGFMGASVKDELTGLLSRAALSARVPELENTAQHRQVAILLADLDHFKLINDSAGHAVGDEVLREAAGRISSCLRPFDAAYRYGGEEFLVLLPDTSPTQAAVVAERVREAIGARPCAGFPITVSVGVCAPAPQEHHTMDELFAVADESLYGAKHAGRNCVFVERAPTIAEPAIRQVV